MQTGKAFFILFLRSSCITFHVVEARQLSKQKITKQTCVSAKSERGTTQRTTGPTTGTTSLGSTVRHNATNNRDDNTFNNNNINNNKDSAKLAALVGGTVGGVAVIIIFALIIVIVIIWKRRCKLMNNAISPTNTVQNVVE